MTVNPYSVFLPGKTTNNISYLMKHIEQETDEADKDFRQRTKTDYPTLDINSSFFDNYKKLLQFYYAMGLRDLEASYNTPKLVIQERWNPSKCPNCEHTFSDFEDCDDGYYDRAYNLTRCPFCGQKLKWDSTE